MSLYACRLVRSFSACRLSIILASFFLIATRLASATTLAGQVTDPDGRGISYSAVRISAFAELVQRSETLDLEPNFGSFGGLFPAPGYSTVNAGISVPIGRRLQVFARG